jgi:hypothetical protein
VGALIWKGHGNDTKPVQNSHCKKCSPHSFCDLKDHGNDTKPALNSRCRQCSPGNFHGVPLEVVRLATKLLGNLPPTAARNGTATYSTGLTVAAPKASELQATLSVVRRVLQAARAATRAPGIEYDEIDFSSSHGHPRCSLA